MVVWCVVAGCGWGGLRSGVTHASSAFSLRWKLWAYALPLSVGEEKAKAWRLAWLGCHVLSLHPALPLRSQAEMEKKGEAWAACTAEAQRLAAQFSEVRLLVWVCVGGLVV